MRHKNRKTSVFSLRVIMTRKPTLIGIIVVWLILHAAGRDSMASDGAGSIPPLQQFLTDTVRENIPHTFEDKSKWGMTSERWDGLHVRLDGLRLKTKRRKKQVNDGDWQMYRVQLVDPREQFAVRVWNVHARTDGRIAFEASVTARIHAFARVSKWVKGVQLYSFGVDADAYLTLFTQGSVGLKFDLSKVPPDVLLDARVDTAEVRLDQFELDRVSNVRGDIAEELGRGLHQTIRRRIARHNDRLVVKFNRAIEKNRDELRLSLHDFMASQWGQLVERTASSASESVDD